MNYNPPLLQAQPEHGVYTVFVELDNTKIEVRIEPLLSRLSFIVTLLSLFFPLESWRSTFLTSFLNFLLSLASVTSGFFSFVTSVTQTDRRRFGLPLGLTPSILPCLTLYHSCAHPPFSPHAHRSVIWGIITTCPWQRYMRSYHHMPIAALYEKLSPHAHSSVK